MQSSGRRAELSIGMCSLKFIQLTCNVNKQKIVHGPQKIGFLITRLVVLALHVYLCMFSKFKCYFVYYTEFLRNRVLGKTIGTAVLYQSHVCYGLT